jgi:hypothetical protein
MYPQLCLQSRLDACPQPRVRAAVSRALREVKDLIVLSGNVEGWPMPRPACGRLDPRHCLRAGEWHKLPRPTSCRAFREAYGAGGRSYGRNASTRVLAVC